MNDTQTQLENLWDHAVSTYQQGNRDPADFFDADQLEFISSTGLSPQEVFDYAEDYITAGEPDFATFARVHEVRRRYFEEVQGSQAERRDTALSYYPNPNDSHQEISYLPRIIAKAKTKLNGTLNPDIMYGCSNDRRFLNDHEIDSTDFLQKVWDTNADSNQLATWIREPRKRRSID